jgi:hypothetical protein
VFEIVPVTDKELNEFDEVPVIANTGVVAVEVFKVNALTARTPRV